ncbi:exonuclease SbcCD subunit D, partial [Paenibacillus darwinianus]
AYTINPAALQIGAQYTALGHLHRPQRVHGDETVRYSGSPLAYSFSESGQAKSVVVFDAEPGMAVSPREILLRSGRPVVRWKAKNGMAEVFGWLDEGRDARAWIDLEIAMTDLITTEQIQQLRKLHDGLLHIRPIYPDMEGCAESEASVRERLPVEELFRRFYTRQTGGAEPDAETVALFMELIAEHEEPSAGAVRDDDNESRSHGAEADNGEATA